jgi:hypothetical protein
VYRAEGFFHDVPAYCGVRSIRGTTLIGNALTGLGDFLGPARPFSYH